MKFISYESRDQLYHALGVPVPKNVEDLESIMHPQPTNNEIIPLITNLFNQDEINIVYGDEKIGKSFLANSIAHAIASGSNLDPYHTTPAAKSVWLVSGEMTGAQEAKQTAVSKRIFPQDATECTLLKLQQFPGWLDEEEGQKLFKNMLERTDNEHEGKEKISVVILDNIKTLTKAGDQVAGWRSLFNFLNTLRLEKHLTFIVIHHPVKDGSMGGSADVNIKIDTNWHVTRERVHVSPYDAQDRLKPKNEYYAFLDEKFQEWRDCNPADIWFFLVNRAGRTLSDHEKRTVFMYMNPDLEQPQWHAMDFLAKEHPWSYHTFKATFAATQVLPPSSQPQSEGKASEAYNGEVKPSYEQLKKARSRDYILGWLRIAYTAGNHDREHMGQFFGQPEGKGKEAIDYLCNKHPCTKNLHITEDDYKCEAQKPDSAKTAENEG